jgi:hypothetical protein
LRTASFEPLIKDCLFRIRQNSQVTKDRKDKNRIRSTVSKNRVLLAVQKLFDSGEKMAIFNAPIYKIDSTMARKHLRPPLSLGDSLCKMMQKRSVAGGKHHLTGRKEHNWR